MQIILCQKQIVPLEKTSSNLNYRSHKDKFSLIKAWIVHLCEFMMIVGLEQCNEWFNTSLSTDEKNCHIIFRKLGKFCNTILARTHGSPGALETQNLGGDKFMWRE